MLSDNDKEFINSMKETDIFWGKTLVEKLMLRVGGDPKSVYGMNNIVDSPPIMTAVLSSYATGLDKLMIEAYGNSSPNEAAVVEAVLPANRLAFSNMIRDIHENMDFSEEVNCSLINGLQEWINIISRAIGETERY